MNVQRHGLLPVALAELVIACPKMDHWALLYLAEHHLKLPALMATHLGRWIVQTYGYADWSEPRGWTTCPACGHCRRA